VRLNHLVTPRPPSFIMAVVLLQDAAAVLLLLRGYGRRSIDHAGAARRVCKSAVERAQPVEVSSLRREKRTDGAPNGSRRDLRPFSETEAGDAILSASNREALLTPALNAF
jgi:hypothetical protein